MAFGHNYGQLSLCAFRLAGHGTGLRHDMKTSFALHGKTFCSSAPCFARSVNLCGPCTLCGYILFETALTYMPLCGYTLFEIALEGWIVSGDSPSRCVVIAMRSAPYSGANPRHRYAKGVSVFSNRFSKVPSCSKLPAFLAIRH